MKRTSLIVFYLVFTIKLYCQNTILWKVTDTVSNKESFILGTFHQMGNSFVDSIPEIKEYLLKSELAVFESIGNKKQTQNQINNRERSESIEKHLKKNDLDFLISFSKDWNIDIYKLTPVEIRFKLMQEFQKINCGLVKPTDSWDHFDNYLIHMAKEGGVKTLGLETDSIQIELINKQYNFPEWKKEKKQIKYWIQQLQSEKPAKVHCEFAKQYMSFILDYELKLRCANDVLLKERNANWMKVIPELLHSKKCFLAVGLFHLYKKCGLIVQLKQEGFKVEPIILKSANNTK